MYINFTASICFFIIILIILIDFMSKRKVNKLENKLFKTISVLTLFGLVLEFIIYGLFIGHYNYNQNLLLFNICAKSLLLYYIVWMYFFVAYTYLVCFYKGKKAYKKFVYGETLAYLTFFVLVLVLPFKIKMTNSNFIPLGAATQISYLIGAFGILFVVVCCLIKFKKLRKKKYIPLIGCILMAVVSIVLQNQFPDLLLMVPSHAIAVMLMYFTIENPDMAMIEQLNVLKDQAERANNAKSEFLSSMSHEIRTPLNAIVGFSQALLEEDLSYQAKEEVKDIVMASDTLLEIVNGILDISKIEANKLEIVDTEYCFNTLLEELVSLTKARLGEKPIDFKCIFSSDLPKYMYGDKVRIKQIVLNLLTNAVKYTKSGWIEFRVNCVNEGDVCKLIISVQDTGMGIKQDSISKLFNKFERLDIEKNNTIEGTGLGLAITKKLLELMGGQIVVQSIYGEGSKFTVTIDQKIVTNPINPILENKEEVKLTNLDLTNKRILVVDDNLINLKVASRLLQDYHCIVDTLPGGAECISKISMGASYDLILMDDMMPKMSGVETLHKLQELEGFNTPVVALTANAISGMREKYIAEGFNEYLSKPIDKTELNRLLNDFLG